MKRRWIAWVLAAVLLAGAMPALAQEGGESTVRTVRLSDPVFHVDGEEALDLSGLSFTFSQMNDSVYLRLDAGSARLAMGAGFQDGMLLGLMDGLSDLYALPVDMGSALATRDMAALSDAQFWQDLLDESILALQRGTAEDVRIEIQGEMRDARKYTLSLSEQELNELLGALFPMSGTRLPGARGELSVAEDNVFALHLDVDGGITIEANGARGEEDSSLTMVMAQDGIQNGTLSLIAGQDSVNLEAEYGEDRLSLAAQAEGGALTSHLDARFDGMELQATGLHTDRQNEWRAILSGGEGEAGVRIEAAYNAEITSDESGGTQENGTFHLDTDQFSVSFALESNTNSIVETASFLDGLDAPIVRLDELSEAERMALTARVQAQLLNFAAGAIQNVPGLTAFASMIADPLSGQMSEADILSALDSFDAQSE